MKPHATEPWEIEFVDGPNPGVPSTLVPLFGDIVLHHRPLDPTRMDSEAVVQMYRRIGETRQFAFVGQTPPRDGMTSFRTFLAFRDAWYALGGPHA